MTTKQIFNLVAIVTAILAAVGLILPCMVYGGSTNYNYFQLAFTRDGFMFTLFVVIVFTVVNIAFGLMSLSYYNNKYLFLVSLVASFIAGMLAIFTKKFSGGNNTALWIKTTKEAYGVFFVIIGNLVSTICYSVIAIRTYVFKNDDNIEVIEDNNDETEEKSSDWFEQLGEEKPEYGDEIIKKDSDDSSTDLPNE